MGSLEIGQEIAAGGRAYKGQMDDYDAQDTALGARYGATNGVLDASSFIDPKDPFSVTGAAKRLFRQQQQQQQYGAFAGGSGLDGSARSQEANLAIDQQQKQRDITDEYLGAKAGIQSGRVNATGGWGSLSASLGTQLASAFADENTATLGAATPAAPGVGEKGGAPSTPVKHEFKRVGGKLYRRIQGSGQKWVLVG